MKQKTALILVYISACTFFAQAYKAFICVPVADLVGEPMSFIDGQSEQAIEKQYDQIPFISARKQCTRLHQALFNEQIEIIEEKDYQVQLIFYGAFYQKNEDPTPQSVYWTLKRNIMPLDRYKNKHIATFLPPSVNFHYPPSTQLPTNVVVLYHSWSCPTTGTTFSAGTRFCLLPHQKKQDVYHVMLFDITKNKPISVEIPRSYCIKQQPASLRKKRHLLRDLLRSWTQYQPPIPYVWGGCSTPALSDAKNRSPLRGFDCSGLILRAMQLCGFPYFFKNSYTIDQAIKPGLKKTLEIGDILWSQGHVMVVSDTAKNLLIGAFGYESLYGSVQELTLEQRFGAIKTYDELLAAINEERTVTQYGKTGKRVKQGPLKLLSLNGLAGDSHEH